MFERIRTLVRDLTGRNDAVLVDHLLGQVDAGLEGVALARRVVTGEVAPDDGLEQVADIEHRGDGHRRELIVELSSTLAPPIDREDLFRLSRSVDDVLDNLQDLVREMALFGVEREPLLLPALDGVADGLGMLHDGVAALVDEPGRAQDRARTAKKNDVRRSYEQAVAELLPDDDPVTGRHIKRRQLLRRMDVVGLRLGEAADALADGMVKRNQ